MEKYSLLPPPPLPHYSPHASLLEPYRVSALQSCSAESAEWTLGTH